VAQEQAYTPRINPLWYVQTEAADTFKAVKLVLSRLTPKDMERRWREALVAIGEYIDRAYNLYEEKCSNRDDYPCKVAKKVLDDIDEFLAQSELITKYVAAHALQLIHDKDAPKILSLYAHYPRTLAAILNPAISAIIDRFNNAKELREKAEQLGEMRRIVAILSALAEKDKRLKELLEQAQSQLKSMEDAVRQELRETIQELLAGAKELQEQLSKLDTGTLYEIDEYLGDACKGKKK